MAGYSAVGRISRIGRSLALSYIKPQYLTPPCCTSVKQIISNETNSRFISVNRTSCRFLTTSPNKDSSTTADTTPNLDEFRNREEKREEEFNKEQPKQENTDDKINNIRSDILNAALPFVDSLGWSREAISKGAESIGYPGVIHGMFPKGGIELVHHFYSQNNRKLFEMLNEEKLKDPSVFANPVDVIKKAIKVRLQMNEPYLKHWRQAIAMMALPPNVPTSLAQLLTLADDIAYYAGDRSVDFGWYIRRIGLASIYKMTELYMLNDDSENKKETWVFLDRRMEEGIVIQQTLEMSETTSKNMAKALASTFSTARNILGLNFNRR